MKKGLIAFFAAVAVVASMGVLAHPIYAEDDTEDTDKPTGNSLRLTPTSTQISLVEGTVLEGSSEGCKTALRDSCNFEVQNSGTTTFTYKVYVTPYMEYSSDDGNEVSFEDAEGISYTQLSRWIKVKDAKGNYVDSATFSIKPGETHSVYYKISIPDSIPGGSQYAVIWAEIQSDEDESDGIVTLGRVGMKVIGKSTTNTIESAEIHDINIKGFAMGGELDASAKIKNTGNTDFMATYSYTAKTIFGKEIFYAHDSRSVFPEMDYKLEVKWDEKSVPLLGLFVVDFNISGGGATENISKLVVVMPLWVLALVILLLTIVIVWIIILIRKRKERTVRKLV